MIQGSFIGPPGRRRPHIEVPVAIGPTGTARSVAFLIDTGADRGLLSAGDAEALGLDLPSLPPGRSRGVGGTAATRLAEAILRIGERRFRVMFRVLVGGEAAHETAHRRIPSVLGGDVLSHFGLYIEERRDLVLLLEPHESERLSLPI